jgi:hypothetical protein
MKPEKVLSSALRKCYEWHLRDKGEVGGIYDRLGWCFPRQESHGNEFNHGRTYFAARILLYLESERRAVSVVTP